MASYFVQKLDERVVGGEAGKRNIALLSLSTHVHEPEQMRHRTILVRVILYSWSSDDRWSTTWIFDPHHRSLAELAFILGSVPTSADNDLPVGISIRGVVPWLHTAVAARSVRSTQGFVERRAWHRIHVRCPLTFKMKERK